MLRVEQCFNGWRPLITKGLILYLWISSIYIFWKQSIYAMLRFNHNSMGEYCVHSEYMNQFLLFKSGYSCVPQWGFFLEFWVMLTVMLLIFHFPAWLILTITGHSKEWMKRNKPIEIIEKGLKAYLLLSPIPIIIWSWPVISSGFNKIVNVYFQAEEVCEPLTQKAYWFHLYYGDGCFTPNAAGFGGWLSSPLTICNYSIARLASLKNSWFVLRILGEWLPGPDSNQRPSD